MFLQLPNMDKLNTTHRSRRRLLCFFASPLEGENEARGLQSAATPLDATKYYTSNKWIILNCLIQPSVLCCLSRSCYRIQSYTILDQNSKLVPIRHLNTKTRENNVIIMISNYWLNCWICIIFNDINEA